MSILSLTTSIIICSNFYFDAALRIQKEGIQSPCEGALEMEGFGYPKILNVEIQ